MARVLTCVLRIAWATRPHNVNLGIAAQIFVYAGIVLLYAINLVFAQRCMRAQHPRIGWSIPFKIFFAFLFFGIVVTLVMLITVLIQSFFTLSTYTHEIDRDIELYGGTFYAVIAFMPLVLIAIGLLIPRHSYIEKFGMGRFRTKEEILALASALLTLGAAFRGGINYLNPVPLRAPTPWYFSKAAFYCFNFTIEILVIILYAVGRIDRRFIIPNGAHGRGSYNPEHEKRMNRMMRASRDWQEEYLEELRRTWPRPYLAQQDEETLNALEGYPRGSVPEDTVYIGSMPFDATELSLDNTSGQWRLRPVSVLSGQTAHTSRTFVGKETRRSGAESPYSARKSWRQNRKRSFTGQSGQASGPASVRGGQGSGKEPEETLSKQGTEREVEEASSHRTEVASSRHVTEKGSDADFANHGV